MNIDRTFRPHQDGVISTTFASDWYLCKGESRDKMGEWLKKTTVRTQDQRKMLQANTHSFPSNYCRHKTTKAKESNRCNLYRTLWISEGRFNTDDYLPIQTLGHIQHQCETLSKIHTLAHHRCWSRLASSKWRLMFDLSPLTINVDQSNRLYSLKNYLVNTCGLFRCKWEMGVGTTCWSPSSTCM
jgi:hypothetical protein